MAILIAIEAKERYRQHGSAPRSEQGNKGSRKLRRLEYSISCDSKCKCSSCGKGRGLSIFSMKPKLLSWSVRGLNEENKCLMVRNLFREWKVDIIYFQETKLEVMSRNVVRIV